MDFLVRIARGSWPFSGLPVLAAEGSWDNVWVLILNQTSKNFERFSCPFLALILLGCIQTDLQAGIFSCVFLAS